MKDRKQTRTKNCAPKKSVGNLVAEAISKLGNRKPDISMNGSVVFYQPRDGDSFLGVPTCCGDNDF